MNDNDDKKDYGIGNFLSDLVALFLILFILECCGCHISEKIGSFFGDGYRAFKTESTIHPSDIR